MKPLTTVQRFLFNYPDVNFINRSIITRSYVKKIDKIHTYSTVLGF